MKLIPIITLIPQRNSEHIRTGWMEEQEYWHPDMLRRVRFHKEAEVWFITSGDLEIPVKHTAAELCKMYEEAT